MEPGKNYEVTVTVKNLSKKVKRIKFKNPKSGTSRFRCDYDIQKPLAAGLSMSITVSFETDVEGDFHDVIKINAENTEAYKLKVHAFKMAPEIIFEPFVNFGFILCGKKKEQTIQFRNEGKAPGVLKLEYDKSTDFSIDPHEFSAVNPAQTVTSIITVTAYETTEFLRKFVHIKVGKTKIGTIDVNATIVKQMISVVFQDGGGTATDLNFGSLYFGETRECNALLVNNGPNSTTFNINFAISGHDQHQVFILKDLWFYLILEP